MVSINPAILNTVKDFAKTALTDSINNPKEGSIFSALNKLGIKDGNSLKEGLNKLKQDPTGTLKNAAGTLKEKGFGKELLGRVSDSIASSGNETDKINSPLLQKLGINNRGDLKAGLDLLKENPSDALSTAAQTLGLNGDQANKLGSKISKFLA